MRRLAAAPRVRRIVLAHHGTTAAVAQGVMRGQALRESVNDYDWLGRGIYFWEESEARAWTWAVAQAERIAKVERRAPRPAVVCVRVDLSRCFDLADARFAALLPEFERSYNSFILAHDAPRPTNSAGLRRLDRAVIDHGLAVGDASGESFEVVRAPFVEGPAAFQGSELHLLSHVQLAVRDPRAILSVFQAKARSPMVRENPRGPVNLERFARALRAEAKKIRDHRNDPEFLLRMRVQARFVLPDGRWLPPFRAGDERFTEMQVRALRLRMIRAWERRTGQTCPFST